MTVGTFSAGNRFLSNFYYCPILWGGTVYPSAEHLYQARKTSDPQWQERIASAVTPRSAKELGQQAPLINGWDYLKVAVMEDVVREKFRQNSTLNDQLIATGEQVLIEGNSWHDQFWGDCWCPQHRRIDGKNALGIVLMRVRLEAGLWR